MIEVFYLISGLCLVGTSSEPKNIFMGVVCSTVSTLCITGVLPIN